MTPVNIVPEFVNDVHVIPALNWHSYDIPVADPLRGGAFKAFSYVS
jgi:hypothetical protein